MENKKNIVVGICGGIAVYKACQLVSDLVKKDYDVHVIMTKNAIEFANPLTFETLTKNHVISDTFDRTHSSDVRHITLARNADLFVIVPATANIIAKIAAGIADDMLTSTILPATCPVLIAPAMNSFMYENPITQRNIKTLKEFAYYFVEPEVGLLACGDVGNGKLASNDAIMEEIDNLLVKDKPLLHKKVLVTAGPTIEKMDPVRFLSNHSSGKMGYALARQARYLGADVTLISGPTNLKFPRGIKVVSVESSIEMFEQVQKEYPKQDIMIKAAAVADYTFAEYQPNKIKKTIENTSFKLIKTNDILAYLGSKKANNQVVCGFAMETENLIQNAQDKLKNKGCDILIANQLNQEGAGFNVDTNIVTIITKDNITQLPLLSKDQVAIEVLHKCLEILKRKEESIC